MPGSGLGGAPFSQFSGRQNFDCMCQSESDLSSKYRSKAPLATNARRVISRRFGGPECSVREPSHPRRVTLPQV